MGINDPRGTVVERAYVINALYLGMRVYSDFSVFFPQVVVLVAMGLMVVVICVFCVLVVSHVPVLMVWTLSMEVTEHVLVSRNVGNSRGEHLRRNTKHFSCF